MRRILLTAIFLLLPALVAAAAHVRLEPPVIGSGGVSLLHWQGRLPDSATIRFNGREIPLRSQSEEGAVLLGADLELAPGQYPITIHHSDGREIFHSPLALQVQAVERREEHLTLPPEMVTPKDPDTLRRIAREQARLAEIFSRESSNRAWRDFVPPVEDPMGSPFGLRRILNGEPRSPHAGIDYRSPRGTPIRSPAPGRAVFAGELYFTGKTVVLDHGGGLFSLYAHLEDFACAEGAMLEQGEVLGRVGSSGRSTGPHLHWGFKLRGERIDPLAILALLGAGKGLDSPSEGGNN